ncbi:MAG: FAD-dependent oxidoreductase, partial [Raoultibacter sp.]
SSRLSRRNFLKGSALIGGIALGGVALSACTPQEKAEPIQSVGMPEKWDSESDVVIVGFGGAGAAAAWEALNAGDSVTILEKQDKAGGSTKICGGLIFLGGGTPTQKAAGFEETVENYYNYLVTATGPGVSEEHCRVLADNSLDLHKWLVDTLGVEFKGGYNPPWPAEENYKAGLSCTGDEFNLDYVEACTAIPHSHWVDGLEENLEGALTGSKNGSGFFVPLQKAVENFSPEILYKSPAEKLVVHPETGRVVGVVTKKENAPYYIKARKGVVLSSGGFAMNEDMVHQYIPYAEGGFVIGTPGDTGDGIRMGQGIGAGTRHMNFAYGQFSPATTWMARDSVVGGPLCFGILVSQRGVRFIGEDHYAGSYYAQVMRNPYYYRDYATSYMIFDSETYEQMVAIKEPKPEDILAKGESIGEIAQILGTPSGALENTVAYYNEFAAQKQDPVWNKRPDYIRSISTPPYYALSANTMSGLFTYGGLKINTESQVLAAIDDTPIPGLYSAGRNASDILGCGYCGSGASVASCYTFGRIAGRNAAAETPWE